MQTVSQVGIKIEIEINKRMFWDYLHMKWRSIGIDFIHFTRNQLLFIHYGAMACRHFTISRSRWLIPTMMVKYFLQNKGKLLSPLTDLDWNTPCRSVWECCNTHTESLRKETEYFKNFNVLEGPVVILVTRSQNLILFCPITRHNPGFLLHWQ